MSQVVCCNRTVEPRRHPEYAQVKYKCPACLRDLSVSDHRLQELLGAITAAVPGAGETLTMPLSALLAVNSRLR